MCEEARIELIKMKTLNGWETMQLDNRETLEKNVDVIHVSIERAFNGGLARIPGTQWDIWYK